MLILTAAVSAASLLAVASASALNAHGQLLQLAHSRANTNQSSNWFGYDQGTIEKGGKLFNSVGGSWTVPTVTQHAAGQAEYSSDWIGIGGGCPDAGCTTSDNTWSWVAVAVRSSATRNGNSWSSSKQCRRSIFS